MCWILFKVASVNSGLFDLPLAAPQSKRARPPRGSANISRYESPGSAQWTVGACVHTPRREEPEEFRRRLRLSGERAWIPPRRTGWADLLPLAFGVWPTSSYLQSQMHLPYEPRLRICPAALNSPHAVWCASSHSPMIRSKSSSGACADQSLCIAFGSPSVSSA
jgi:hypothetical protein